MVKHKVIKMCLAPFYFGFLMACATSTGPNPSRGPASELVVATERNGDGLTPTLAEESVRRLPLLAYSEEATGAFTEAELGDYQCLIGKIENGSSAKFVVSIVPRTGVDLPESARRISFREVVYIPLAKVPLDANVDFPPVASRISTVYTKYNGETLENRTVLRQRVNGDLVESLLKVPISSDLGIGNSISFEMRRGPSNQKFEFRATTKKLDCGIRIS